MIIENADLRFQFRLTGRCEWCRRAGAVDPHHVFACGRGGRLDVRINLIAMHRECHNQVHAGAITQEHLLAIVAIREGVPPRDIVDVIHFLRRTPNRATTTTVERNLRELNPGARALARSILAKVAA